jgi:hypothetical protein
MKSIGNQPSLFLQPAFLICTAVLALAGGGMSLAIRSLGGYLKKEPLPLKKSLELLDEEQLAPYRVISKYKIEHQDLLEELGTEDYIQWVLEDTDSNVDGSMQRVLLFITYYELPDRVPHVPEECYTGGGFQRLSSDSVTFEINMPDFKRTIEGKYLVFGSTKVDFWGTGRQFPVLYIFRVNGEYAGDRDQARIALNKNFFGRYSYFSKVELAFNQALVAQNEKEVIKAGEKLLSVILPILEKEHWPEWNSR